jgi:hypothetical protein
MRPKRHLQPTFGSHPMRYFRVIVRPDPDETDAAHGYIEAEDEASARAKLPTLDGLLLFDHSEKMHRSGFGEAWCNGRHIIERARKAQGLPSPKSH